MNGPARNCNPLQGNDNRADCLRSSEPLLETHKLNTTEEHESQQTVPTQRVVDPQTKLINQKEKNHKNLWFFSLFSVLLLADWLCLWGSLHRSRGETDIGFLLLLGKVWLVGPPTVLSADWLEGAGRSVATQPSVPLPHTSMWNPPFLNHSASHLYHIYCGRNSVSKKKLLRMKSRCGSLFCWSCFAF